MALQMSVCTGASLTREHLRKSGHSGCGPHSLDPWVPSPRAPRTTAQSPSHLPPSSPRPLHMRRPHPPTDIVLPPRHIHCPPAPQTPPSHPRRSRPSLHTDTTLIPNNHIRRTLCVTGTPRPTVSLSRRTKENRQRRSQGKASGVRNSITLTHPVSPPAPPAPSTSRPH